MIGVVVRAIVTALVFFIYRVVGAALYGTTTLASGQLAGQQFLNSNEAYLRTQVGFSILTGPGLVLTIVTALILFALWFKYVKMAYKYLATAMLVVILLSGSNAHAYYNKQDLTEIYQILPNQTVFWVPDVGANKESQAQFDSEAYLKDARIAGKRFQIKHDIIVGSTGWSERDYYGPVGRLYVVIREPFNRKWTASHATGTSSKNESFTCQSIEGLNVTMETSIGTRILPEHAYKYLYNFGIKSPGDPKLPEVVFTSVYYARDLAEVMDNVVHGNIYGLACQEFSIRTLDTINLERDKIQKEIEKKCKAVPCGTGHNTGLSRICGHIYL